MNNAVQELSDFELRAVPMSKKQLQVQGNFGMREKSERRIAAAAADATQRPKLLSCTVQSIRLRRVD